MSFNFSGLVIIFCLVSVDLFPQTETQMSPINIRTIHKNVLENTPGLRARVINSGNDGLFFNFGPSLDSDFNFDNRNDLFVNVSSNPENKFIYSLFTQSSLNSPSFTLENYIEIQGDGTETWRSVDDFDNDGYLDVYIRTSNYHGNPNNFPDYYQLTWTNDEGLEEICYDSYDKLLWGSENGFSEQIIEDRSNTGGPIDICPLQTNGLSIIEINDSKTIIIGSPPCNNLYNSNYYLLRGYNFNNRITEKNFFVTNEFINDNRCFISTDTDLIHQKENYLYIPIVTQKYTHEGNTGIVGDQYWNENNLWGYDENLFNERSILKVEILEETLSNSYIKIDFTTMGDYDFSDEFGLYVEDIDNDDEYEYIVYGFDPSKPPTQSLEYTQSHSRIFIYESNGEDVTNQWLDWTTYQEGFNIFLSKTDFNIPLSWDPTDRAALGFKMIDLNQDGYIDLVPKYSWSFNKSSNNINDFTSIIFLNNGNKLIPHYLNFSDNHRNSSGLYNSSDGGNMGYVDIFDYNNDGIHELIHFINGPNNSVNNIDIIELSFDNDNDGIINQEDANPNDPYSISNDIDGNRIFNLPNNNYTISLENLSCIGENDGSISISLEDEDLNYTLRVNGENTVVFNSSQGYQQTLSNLSPGIYHLCFTVEGESGYNQCFDVNITEPAPLSASSKVDKEGKSMSFSLEGSDRYTIVHNGVEREFDISNPEIPLKKGINFIEVKTDKQCQGTYTEEVFISEKVEFYPNPTIDVVNLFIHGKDKTVDLKIVDRNGNIIGTSCRDIQSNRKIQVNLEKYPKGIYLIQTKGETVQKTIKIIRE